MELNDKEIEELRNLMAESRRTLEERFWENVDVKTIDECWEWKGNKNSAGYGMFHTGTVGIGAHRMAWEIRYKHKVPPELLVLHHCDNPGCVNHNHLYCGTHKENSMDMLERERYHSKEEPFKNVTLSIDTILKIRDLKGCRMHQGDKTQIAKDFNITVNILNKIWESEIQPCKEQFFIRFKD